MKSAIVLLSGGLDSTTCLAMATSQNYKCHTISFDYNQRHCAELIAAKKISASFHAVSHHVITLPSCQFDGSALTDPRINVPKYNSDTDQAIPVTYVPARNTVFLAFALGLAEVLNVDDIFVGVSAIDYSNYPDCRPEYITAFQTLANLATKAGVNGEKITINAPLIHLSKSETIKIGLQLGVDYTATVSCYQANDYGEACGSCDSCMLRKKGFKEAGVEDQTRYFQSL